MTISVKAKHFAGGVAVAVPDKDDVDLADMVRAIVADNVATRAALALLAADHAALRAAYALLLAKLDADGGVTDVDYAATTAPAAATYAAPAAATITAA